MQNAQPTPARSLECTHAHGSSLDFKTQLWKFDSAQILATPAPDLAGFPDGASGEGETTRHQMSPNERVSVRASSSVENDRRTAVERRARLRKLIPRRKSIFRGPFAVLRTYVPVGPGRPSPTSMFSTLMTVFSPAYRPARAWAWAARRLAAAQPSVQTRRRLPWPPSRPWPRAAAG